MFILSSEVTNHFSDPEETDAGLTKVDLDLSCLSVVILIPLFVGEEKSNSDQKSSTCHCTGTWVGLRQLGNISHNQRLHNKASKWEFLMK